MIAMGVMGAGLHDQGIPVVTEMINHVSKQFDIVYYSLQPVNAQRIFHVIEVKPAISWRIPGRLKYLFQMFRIAIDHFINPFQLIYAIAVYPTGQMAMTVSKITRCPVVVHFLALEAAGLADIQYGNLISPFLKKLAQRIVSEADEIIVLSEYQKEIAQRSLPTNRDFLVRPLSIDCQKFPYHERSISYPVKFLHVGFYHPVKDQETLFRAFSKIAKRIECELIVIGDGFHHKSVNTLLTELDISDKVIFKGHLRHEELTFEFSKIHIMLHSSRFESQCVAALEAMASGIPVCSTRVGILADLGDDFAVLVPVGDADQLAQKTLALIHDNERYNSIRDIAYRWITAHDCSWSGNQYASLFKGLLAKNPKADH